MKQLFTSTGRISRSTFWNYYATAFGIFVFLGLILDLAKPPEWAKNIIVLPVFPILCVGILTQIKRWHDLDKSGWWILINLIPFFGGLWTFIECGCVAGTKGSNRFGADPLAPAPPPLPPR